MRTNIKDSEFQTIGFSSILVVFVMLALSTFTVLTLVSANADYKLTKTMAEGDTAYEEASNRAKTRVAELDRLLAERYETGGMLPASAVRRILPEDMAMETSTEGCLVSFTETIDERQDLAVELLIPQVPSDGFYQILRWQKTTSVSQPDPGAEETLHVL